MLKKLLGQLLLQAWRAIWPGRARGPAPLAPQTLRQAFDARMQVDDYDGALALAASAVERDASAYEAQLLLGRAQQKLHAAERALACFETARRMRADDPELYDFRRRRRWPITTGRSRCGRIFRSLRFTSAWRGC